MIKKLPKLSRRAPTMESGAGSGGDELQATASHDEAVSKGRGPSLESMSQASGPVGPDEEVQRRIAQAKEIVRRRTKWAMAGGLLPIPVFDIVAVAGVQLAMLRELSVHYGVPFERNLVKSLITALLGSVLPYVAGAGLAGSIAKVLPVLGWGVGFLATSVLAGATTHATGVVFVQHFESGGTFLDFDPAATRDFFRREFEIARREGRAISSTDSA
jgi:uncharacterized protein (DUF697 family)